MKITGGNHDKARRIVIAGTGGQGVLTAARFLTHFFLRSGEQVLSGQLHGMAQRGGSVQSTVMINCGISPAIPRGSADIVVGFEPVETVRSLGYISSKTRVFMNLSPVIPFVLSQNAVLGQGITQYPDIDGLVESIRQATDRVYTLDATRLATEAGAAQAMNMVMLGSLIGAEIFPCTPDGFLDSVLRITPEKFAEINRKAFFLGVESVKKTNLFKEIP